MRSPRSRYRPEFLVLETRLVFSITIGVDAGAGLHPISSGIYGVAYGDASGLADLNATINRYGGNNASRYNWQLNADNRASDYFFESIGDSSTTAGERGDTFISTSRQGGAQPDLTIPMIDWVARLGANRSKLGSFSVAKYGPQQATDPYFPDAGNGVSTSGQDITGNNPSDADVANSTSFEQGWVQHLVSQWGLASAGGLRYYSLDNEPSIWFSTHRDVHPVGPTMQEILDKTIAYAAMIKSVDPSATIIGPEEWGWSGYLYSGYDQQYAAAHNYSSYPDRAAHNNMDYLPWLLQRLQAHQTATGKRLLDIFSVHYYPQGGEFGNDVSTSMELLRNQSTRSLWDPSYVDQSWINDKVDLIPRLHNWVNTYYPGTQIGLTEYNWGAEGYMNGATTQADILGILGREQADIATRWTMPAAGTPVYNAIKMYRDYDGNKSTFGNTSISTTVPNPDQVSAFSAIRSSDGSLTIMVVNKNLVDPNNLSATTSITINLSNFNSLGTAQEWQLFAPNPGDLTTSAIQRLADVSFSGNSFTINVPMESVTLFVLKPKTTAQPGTLQFARAAYNVSEARHSITLTVMRTGGTDGAVSVHYATANGTALAGTDYTGATGTLNFGPGIASQPLTITITDDGSASESNIETFTVTLSNAQGGAVIGTTAATTVSIREHAASIIVAGADAGGGPEVKAYDAKTGAVLLDFYAYDPRFNGGVRVAAGDINGDGIADIITAPGPGGGPDIRVFDGATGALIEEFMAYSPYFTAGVYIAAGDVEGNGKADIITAPGAGGGPDIRIYSGATGQLIREWMAYDPRFTGGVYVASGDVDGNGKADIITAPGAGGGPDVRVYSGATGQLIREWMAYDPSLSLGVRVGAADVNGDGKMDIVASGGPGYPSLPIKAFDATNAATLDSFFAYDSRFLGGVFVGGV